MLHNFVALQENLDLCTVVMSSTALAKNWLLLKHVKVKLGDCDDKN